MGRVKSRWLAAICVVMLAGIQTEVYAAVYENLSCLQPREYLAETPVTETIPADWLEEPNAASEEELSQMVDHYLEQMDSGKAGTEDVHSENIVDPKLWLEQAPQGRVRYTLPNKSTFTVTVPNGMITAQDVEFEFSGNVMAVVKRNDDTERLVDVPKFTEPGSYHMKMIFYQSTSTSDSDYNVYEVNYYFTIIGEVDRTLGVVTAPKDFRITEAKKDGVPLEVVQSRAVFLEEDGVYEIRYQDLDSGTIHLSTVFERDTTAPFLTFSKESADGVFVGPVEYYPSEINSTIVMTYNGNRGPAVSNVLTAGGRYQLEVTDSVGNSRFYHVTVRQTYQLIDKRLIILALILLGVLGLKLLVLRKDMRVI